MPIALGAEPVSSDASRSLERLRTSKVAVIRSTAASELGAQQGAGEEIERALVQALGDRSVFVQIAAGRALFALDPARPAEPIVQAFRRGAGREVPDPYTEPDGREIIELGLVFAQTLPLVQELSRAAEDPDRRIRLEAVKNLGVLRSADCRPALENATRDPDARVRRAARRALRHTPKP